MTSLASAQVPSPGELVVDHVGHFVPHMDAASSALETLGFTLTPFSAHSHRSEPGGPLVPAGAGNRCVILERGYLEIVTPTGDTPHASQLRAAIRRYTGPHLIAFGTAAPEADYARIRKSGFDPLPMVALQRQIGTETGEGTVRFTVVRVPPGTMPEGRIQFCRHDTPELVWQQRWIAHPNGAVALTGVILCVADPQEAARRYARFAGLLAQVADGVWRLTTARGYLVFVNPEQLGRRLEIAPPALPWIAGCVLRSGDIAATGEYLRQSKLPVRPLGGRWLLVKAPPEAGGIVVFEPAGAGALNFN